MVLKRREGRHRRRRKKTGLIKEQSIEAVLVKKGNNETRILSQQAKSGKEKSGNRKKV